MDGKNKLTETYLPDKSSKKDKVVVGLSGSVDSLVTAYLLKIQRYDLIAVTIAPSWEDFGKDTGDILSCGLTEQRVETLQSITHQLGIPHFVVKIPREFRELVVERWMARKAAGEMPDQCWACHEMRMQYLHTKMKELGAKNLATGHFAKIFRHDAEALTYVQSSNDEQYDQSALLSRLPQEILRDLLLPLSDLQKKEVLKLAENFGFEEMAKKMSIFHCFPENEETIGFLEAKLPLRFKREGILVGEKDERIADHEGVFRHRKGEQLAVSEERIPLFFARYVTGEKKILLKTADWFQKTKIVLRACMVPPETPWIAPFRAVLVKEGKAVDAWFYPKSLDSCLVELDAPLAFLDGETLCVQKKKGKNARVLLSGIVNFIDDVKTEGEANVQVDYGREF